MALRILPCPNCRSGQATLPGGSPYTLGRPPDGAGIIYKCARCKRKPPRLTAVEFNRLPALSLADLEAAGVSGLVTNDLAGQGFRIEHLEQLEGAGIDPLSIHSMPDRGQE